MTRTFYVGDYMETALVDANPKDHLRAVEAAFRRTEEEHGFSFGPYRRDREEEAKLEAKMQAPGHWAKGRGCDCARVYAADVIE